MYVHNKKVRYQTVIPCHTGADIYTSRGNSVSFERNKPSGSLRFSPTKLKDRDFSDTSTEDGSKLQLRPEDGTIP